MAFGRSHSLHQGLAPCVMVVMLLASVVQGEPAAEC